MVNKTLILVNIPQITNDIAKFDGRRKKYVLLNTFDELTATDEQKQEHNEQQLLADLQTQWESLRSKVPDNSNRLQSIAKYYRYAMDLNNKNFMLSDSSKSCFDDNWYVWIKSLNEFKSKLISDIQPLSIEGFEQFRIFAIERVKTQSKTGQELKQAWTTIAEFINYQNMHYMLAEHYYPVLIPPKTVKVNPLVISTNWVTEGKKLTKIVTAVNTHWRDNPEYSSDEILGWLLYSGIVYGGINDPALLAGWLQALTEGQARPFIQERVYLSIRYKQSGYGNERVENSKDIYNTKQVIVDLVSQCWLMRYNAQNSSKVTQNIPNQWSQKQIKSYIFKALSPVISHLFIEQFTLSKLFMYASYHWEMLDEVVIDQASTSILRGKQNHTGLITIDFENYLNEKYKNSTTPSQYDLNKILKLKIEPSIAIENTLAEEDISKILVRKSDVIQSLTKDFKFYEDKKNKDNSKKKDERLTDIYSAFLEKILNRYKQYNALNEKILIKWMLSLINFRDKPSSKNVLHYIKIIGYEWLYFTEGQDLCDWASEDFEEMYDDIFEYKELDRRNTNLSYSAKLFQRMHDFAVKEFGLAPVTIEQAKSDRRVRSELVSPQAYHAIIRQILKSVDILEREMFALLFILVYRTGMRKKELLGLRYIDIEGLSYGQPSIIVRPNKYRSTKTQGSIRRIAIFALLKPSELTFFINFIQSNIGINPNKFIFTLSNAHQPIDDHVPLQLLKKVLKDISIEESANFTFHAFRHTAISNLSLVLNGRQELIQALTDYDSDDVLRIKLGLLGVHIEGSDHWYALSGIMGHLSPQRSFEYYNHIATLMATYELSFADVYLPLRTVNNITSISNKKLVENKAIIETEHLKLTSIRKLLFKTTFKGIRKSPSFTIELANHQLFDYDLSTKSSELFMRYGINKIELLLNESDKLLSLKEAAHLAGINEDDANKFITRAHQVTELATKHSRPRFVRLNESGKPPFSSLNIQHQSDFRMLSVLQHSARKLREHSLEDWQWFIDVCSQRLTTTTPSVSFLKSENEDLLRFIDFAKRLLPAKNWLVISNKMLLTECLAKKNFEGMRGHDRQDVNTVHIGIANRDIRTNQDRWKYSPLLRFFVHMMMISDEEITII